MKSIRLIALILLITALVGTESRAENDKPPNIVMIISDDQAWTDFGFMGHAEIKTPHLDQLARQSVLFRRGYVPTALCRPSLATIITGRYAHQHGITGNDPAPNPAISAAEYASRRRKMIAKLDRFDTIPKLLKQKGYLSFQSGKWWEGSFNRAGFTHGMTRGFPKKGGRHGDDGLKIGRAGMQPILEFMDMAVGQEKPFFLWYAPFLPHTPHNPPERLLSKYQKAGRPESLAKYWAMCEWFDETCGQLLDHLEKTGVADNTMIVYVTDNGWIQRTPSTVAPDGWKTSFAPRSKQTPFEGGIRTPIMIRWPKQIPASDRPEVVSSIDLAPTILAAAGIAQPESLPGINLLPVATNKSKLKRQAIFGESFAHDVVDIDNPQTTLLYRWIIEDKWKLLLTYDGKVTRYGPVHIRMEKRPQLFDLLADPHESINLAEKNPQVVAKLADQIDQWWKVSERKVLTSFDGK